jgi:hypothetical protein
LVQFHVFQGGRNLMVGLVDKDVFSNRSMFAIHFSLSTYQ